jgi:hypothetical protein
MAKKRGRPKGKKKDSREVHLDIRLFGHEKTGFAQAARIAGLTLSDWIRQRLRRDANAEVVAAGQPPIFPVETPV